MAEPDSSSAPVRRRRIAVATTLLIIGLAEGWVILAWNRTGWIGMSLSIGDPLAVSERQQVVTHSLVPDGPGRRAGLCTPCQLVSVRAPYRLQGTADSEVRHAFLTQRPPVGSNITFVQQRRRDGPLETVRVEVEYPLKTESVQIRVALAMVASLFAIGVGLLIAVTRPHQLALWVVAFACWLTGLWVFSKAISSLMLYSDIVSREATTAAYFYGGGSDPFRYWSGIAYALPVLLLAAHLHVLQYIKTPTEVASDTPLYGPYLYFVPSLALLGLEAELTYTCCRGLWTREQLATGFALASVAILLAGHLLATVVTTSTARYMLFFSYLLSAHASASALSVIAAETPARAAIALFAIYFIRVVGAVTIAVLVVIRAIRIARTPSLKTVRVMTAGLTLSALSLTAWFVWSAWGFATQAAALKQPEWLMVAFVYVLPLVSPWTMLIALNRHGVFGVRKLTARFTQAVTAGIAIVVIEFSNDSHENYLGDLGVAVTGTKTVRLALLTIYWLMMKWLIPVERLQAVLTATTVDETSTVGGPPQPKQVPSSDLRSSQLKRERKRNRRKSKP